MQVVQGQHDIGTIEAWPGPQGPRDVLLGEVEDLILTGIVHDNAEAVMGLEGVHQGGQEGVPGVLQDTVLQHTIFF